MDSSRRSTRHLEPKNDSSRQLLGDGSRVPTADSGRASMTISERASTTGSITTNGASSSLSRDTPLDDSYDTRGAKYQDDKPVCIRRTTIWGGRRYEQAYVSHIEHPSAFFIQLAHSSDKCEELDKEINDFYSKNSQENPLKWKSGDYCIAKFKDNRFYRSRIIEIDENKNPADYHVVFVDYGNWDTVSEHDIHLLLPQFAVLTAQAIACSLTNTLPKKGTLYSQEAKNFFRELVLDKFVDAKFYLKSSNDFWPLSCVDLELSSTKANIRQLMIEQGYIRETTNDQIYIEFNHLLKREHYIQFNIPHEEDDNNYDDDD
ncbi:unnamed protein product [Adineta steineri]|uniref:Tudor domain-containing protein n=1 Tax=Adineta steineri TaxID=433720 RepID=A0A818I159_9BILA|nr:unnamed protein product [Adineta steineri]CAF4025908.1 unnamed protein product [Adineta steineri]CAF4194769.1 unnamed protein product [Adineta steineri]